MPAMIIFAKSSPGQMWIVRKDNDSVMVRITWGSGASRAVLLQGYAERHVNNYFNWSQVGTEIDQTLSSPSDNVSRPPVGTQIDQTPGSPSDNVSVAIAPDDH